METSPRVGPEQIPLQRAPNARHVLSVSKPHGAVQQIAKIVHDCQNAGIMFSLNSSGMGIYMAQVGTEVFTTAPLVFNSGNLGTLWQFWQFQITRSDLPIQISVISVNQW
jgi:uncharacterized membrane protein YdbT with pleckstrin-like domain